MNSILEMYSEIPVNIAHNKPPKEKKLTQRGRFLQSFDTIISYYGMPDANCQPIVCTTSNMHEKVAL